MSHPEDSAAGRRGEEGAPAPKRAKTDDAADAADVARAEKPAELLTLQHNWRRYAEEQHPHHRHVVFAWRMVDALGDTALVDAKRALGIFPSLVDAQVFCEDDEDIKSGAYELVWIERVPYIPTSTYVPHLHGTKCSAERVCHLRREVEGNYRQGARDRTGLPVDVPRILRSRRVVGKSFLAITCMLSVPIFVFTGLLFVLFPRVGLSLAGIVAGIVRTGRMNRLSSTGASAIAASCGTMRATSTFGIT